MKMKAQHIWAPFHLENQLYKANGIRFGTIHVIYYILLREYTR
jgi:hypothetical protein